MAENYVDVELLRLAWHNCGGKQTVFTATDGRSIEVAAVGVFDPQNEGYSNAEISAHGVVLRGDIVFSAHGAESGRRETAILHVVPHRMPVITDMSGNAVAQIELEVPTNAVIAYRRMKEGVGGSACGPVIAAYEPVRRVALFTRLLVDRMGRKTGEIGQIYEDVGEDWNETLYVMLLRTMGGPSNKEVFEHLARRVRFSAVFRERSNIMSVEAMLLGASGLLGLYQDDQYTLRLKTEFDHFSRKYSIIPMSAAVWNLGRQNPRNHPVVRIAQLAALICTKDFSFNTVVGCNGVTDLHRLFGADASDYWTTHFVPNSITSAVPKRIGVEKAELFGINMVAPMIFAYGRHMGDERMQEKSIELLENIFGEENSIIRRWRQCGVEMSNAFDTQAILQLNNEYCAGRRCGICPVGKNVIKSCL